MTTSEAVALCRKERVLAILRGANLEPRTGRVNLAFRSRLIDNSEGCHLRTDAFVVHAVASDWGN